MSSDPTTLVLAGAREAHGVVSGLVARGDRVIASLPEEERMFGALPVPTRLGHFDSDAALQDWLVAQSVTRVIDTSHGFDAQISLRAARACAALNLPYLRVLRPEWQPAPQDRWTQFTDVEAAARAVCVEDRVFTNTGRGSLHAYADFRGTCVWMRLTHPTQAQSPFPFLHFLSGTPPFSVHEEETLFRELAITRLICRNVGGAASRSKLLAARKLAIAVSMIARPGPPPGAMCVEDVADALAWAADT